MARTRPVLSHVVSTHTLEGGGFPVTRPFPTQVLMQADPFLLLDHLGPVRWAPGEAIGAPEPPRRGFEAVTYLLQGRMCHEDSFGHKGELNPGDVQWMTAGSGLVHSELPHPEFLAQGGVMEGFQIWVNLPASHKMAPPKYQEVPNQKLAKFEKPSCKVTLIAGELDGHKGPVETVRPVLCAHLELEAGADLELPLPPVLTLYLYVIHGQGRFGEQTAPAQAGDFLFFGAGETVHLEAQDGPVSVLLLGGEPLQEPVARYGPFVMNTKAEVLQAFADFEAGKMGRIGT